MKKVLVLFLLLVFASPIYADEVYINMDLPTDEHIENQMGEVFAILDKAEKTNDLELYYEACDKGYHLKKEGNPQNIKIYNDVLSAAAIKYSLQRYQLTKDKKYFNRAYKWSKQAVEDKTNQIYSIRADIMLASLFLEPKEMTKAYDLYRAVDLEGAQSFQEEYLKSYDDTLAYIKEKSAKRKAAWVKGLKAFGYGLAAGAQSFGNSMQQNTYNRPVSTYCNSIGNSVYCNSY